MSKWSKNEPCEPGRYEVKSAETHYAPHVVCVSRMRGAVSRLYVESQIVSLKPLSIYHANLIDPQWRKLS